VAKRNVETLMAKLRVDLTEKQFNKLVVIKYINKNKNGGSRWLCKCECGRQVTVNGSDLKTGNTKSCGCLRIKHGHTINDSTSQAYYAWSHIKQRCCNKKDKSYPSYGGRGIIICETWMEFENFLKDMGEPPSKKHSIDRINNDNGYYKSNCRWATRKQQQGNMRSNHMVTFSNKTQCLAAWANEIGISQKTLWHRLVTLKWSTKKALTTPVRNRGK